MHKTILKKKLLLQKMTHMARLVRNGQAQFLDVSRKIYHDEYFLRQPPSLIYLTNDLEREPYKIRLVDGKFIKSSSGHYRRKLLMKANRQLGELFL